MTRENVISGSSPPGCTEHLPAYNLFRRRLTPEPLLRAS